MARSAPAALLTTALYALLPAHATARSTLAAGLATWQGRVLDADPRNVSFSWEGVQARFSVSGATTLTLLATPGAFGVFHTLVDGALVTNFTVAASTGPRNFTLATVSRAAHDVVVWAATDPIVASWDTLPPWVHSFHEFASDGALAPGPAKPARRLTIIGDSITAGNQIDNVTCAADHLGTYGARVCQAFDADCQTLAVSGKGIYANCCDKNATMTELSRRTIVSIPEYWDDSRFVPDGVILALGTNDQGHNSGPAWVAGFVQTYADFLVNLTVAHGNNPLLPIICVVGPITHDYFPWVAAAIDKAAARGVSRAQIFNWTSPVDRCGHPAWSAHADAAEVLKPVIARAIGW